MLDRILALLSRLPAAPSGPMPSADDPRVAAAALMFQVMNADGLRQDVEWESVKSMLASTHGLAGPDLERVLSAGAEADRQAIDLYGFTSVLKRHLDPEERVEFIRTLWEIVFADGELHELEGNILWRVAELLGVETRDRVLARREVQAAHGVPASGTGTDGED